MKTVYPPYRAWVNQPSTLQQFHHLHGQTGIVTEVDGGGYARIHFTDGALISTTIPLNALSLGAHAMVTESSRYMIRLTPRDGGPCHYHAEGKKHNWNALEALAVLEKVEQDPDMRHTYFIELKKV